MKLAALYNVFNCLELLEDSVKQIYDFSDVIVLCYQTVSHYGETKSGVKEFLQEKYGSDEKVYIIEYVPDLSIKSKFNEIKKLQMRIDLAKKLGCTHYFSSAEDHFYDRNQFWDAMQDVEHRDWDVTFTKMYTYYKHPTWRVDPPEDYFMPFITKLYGHTRVEWVKRYPVRVDPAVRVNTYKRHRIFAESEIMLHHFSMVRKNIADKFNNAAAKYRWKSGSAERFAEELSSYDINVNPGLSYFQGRKLVEVENRFNLPHFTEKNT